MKKKLRKPYNCSSCGETNPENFYTRSKSKCKTCAIKETVIAHRNNPRYQEKQAKYYRRWYEENGRSRSPEYKDIIILWQARHPNAGKIKEKVNKAIRQGLLERPLRCDMCGRVQCRINAHHNDYNFPFDIIWVCSSCHKKIHLQRTT